VGAAFEETWLGRPARAAASPAAAGIRPGLFYAVFGVLVATNVLAGLALLMSPDLAGIVNGQTAATIAAYEDKLAQLRLEVDKLHSRQFAQTGDINLELQELAQQQEVLAEQHQYVKALADKAAELGIGPALPTAGPSTSGEPVPLAPLPATATTGDAGRAAIEQAGHQVRAMMDESRNALAALSAEATSSTDEILDSLKSIGIKPDMPAASDDAMGGPLLPPEDGAGDPNMVDEANAVVAALTRFESARTALAEAPVHMPVAGPERISSPFGNRVDPFTGRLAFHPGIDFPWPTGTTVMAAGDGKVVFVGQINGYGNCIDIDHGGGIVTRYGHLSAFIASEGETVHTGTPIARVGSTGRSTGPHLHFEVRRNDRPVDPTFFIALGKRLAHFLGKPATADATEDAVTPPAAGDSDDDRAAG
jgi:murein DD-endopeptidase MepM/ murein hydrolase activator NlpD